MAGKIEVVQKWMPYVESIMEEGKKSSNDALKDSAFQMGMTLAKVIELDVDTDVCDVDSAMQSIVSVSYALKNIENDDNIDFAKRKEMARDLSGFIIEQSEKFNNTCICSKR